MAREQIRSPVIDGYQYVVRQLGARTGRKIADELFRALLPALIELAASGDDKKGVKLESIIEGLTAASARNAIEIALKALPPARVDALIDTLAGLTDIYSPGSDEFGDSGAPLSRQFDDHFAGRYKAMYQWLVFALKVNFADFFTEAVGEIVTKDSKVVDRA